MAKHKVIGINGSLRAESWNLKLLRNFLAELGRAGFETELYPSLDMPLVNEDLEQKPLDPRITAFRHAVEKADIVAIASPEYNGSFSAALKNAVDWATRPPKNLWAGKTVVVLGATTGGYGTIRGSIQLRTVLGGIRAWVLPELVLLPFADQAFDSSGQLKNESTKKLIASTVESLQTFASRMHQK